jgi:hypothetical protein
LRTFSQTLETQCDLPALCFLDHKDVPATLLVADGSAEDVEAVVWSGVLTVGAASAEEGWGGEAAGVLADLEEVRKICV